MLLLFIGFLYILVGGLLVFPYYWIGMLEDTETSLRKSVFWPIYVSKGFIRSIWLSINWFIINFIRAIKE